MAQNADEQTVEVPLPKYLEQLADRAAETAARKVIEEHVKSCPLKVDVDGIKSKVILYSGLIGAAAGYGLGWLKDAFTK